MIYLQKIGRWSMTNLTEKWKSGRLEKNKKYYTTDKLGRSYIKTYNKKGFKGLVHEVLAPVPSYEEWQSVCDDCNSMQETIFSQDSIYCENENLLEEIEKIDEENTKLKDLLKECREVLKISIYGSLNELTSSRYGASYLLPKIDEVLNDNE